MAKIRKIIDRNAPARPLSAFNLYMRFKVSQSEELSSKTFAERNRQIGAEWSALPIEEKQPYLDEGAKNRERHKIEMEVYKKSESYKDWLSKQKDSMKISKAKKGRHPKRQDEIESLDKMKSDIDGTRQVPIFTQAFLEYNRQREMALRTLRKQASQLEEETALLSKHVENLTKAGARMEQQLHANESQLASEEAILHRFHKEIVAAFAHLGVPTNGDVPRPSIDSKGTERITMSSIDSYLSRLDQLVSSGQHNDLKVRATTALKAALRTRSMTLCKLTTP